MSATRKPFVPVVLEEGLAVACMAVLLVITLLNVLTRYFTDQSFAWTEEISVFLMVLMTLAGASAATARDRHIRIEFFCDGGSALRRQRLKVFAACITAVLFGVLALLFSRVVADELRYGETSMGMGVPRWWFTIFSPLLCAAIALRSTGVAWAAARSPGPDSNTARNWSISRYVFASTVAMPAVAAGISATLETRSAARRKPFFIISYSNCCVECSLAQSRLKRNLRYGNSVFNLEEALDKHRLAADGPPWTLLCRNRLDNDLAFCIPAERQISLGDGIRNQRLDAKIVQHLGSGKANAADLAS